jgi:glycosyltransferase involved in cell wall biosynthesis
MNAVAARLGGARSLLVPLVDALARDLPETHFDVFVPSTVPEAQHPENVRLIPVDFESGLDVRRLLWDQFQLNRRAARPDVLISPLNYGPLWSPVPHVLFAVNPLYYLSRAERRALGLTGPTALLQTGLHRSCARRADAVVVPTRAMADRIQRTRSNIGPVRVVHHGFDAAGARSAPASLPAHALTWARQEIRLLHVGHPNPQKGLVTLADTLARVVGAKDGSSVCLAVTFEPDEGPDARAFSERVRRHGLERSVVFLGQLPRESVLGLYGRASAFLFPSTIESFGFPVVEALAFGCPIVATDMPSNRELAGRLASYHQAGAAEAAAELVIHALHSDTPALRSKRRARSDEFGWPRSAHETAEVLFEVVARNVRSP